MNRQKLTVAASLVLTFLAVSSRAQGQLAITEVLFDPAGANTGRQQVEVRNLGDTEVNMQSSGYWLYFPPAQWQFPSGVSIPPGGTVLININRPGTSTATTFFTGIGGMRNLRGVGGQGDAIGLFSTNLFGDATKILDFVQWGGPGNAGEEVAVQAGVWPAGGFVDLSAFREGASIVYDGSGNAPQDWCIDGSPTPGATNDSCTTAFARGSVLLNEVGYVRTGPGQYHAAVELINVGEVLEDVGGKFLVLGAAPQASFRFPTGSPDTLIGPGEILTLHMGVDGLDGPLEIYSGAGTLRVLLGVDSVSLHAVQTFSDATGVLDFVQWGAAGTPLEAAAVGAQRWIAGQQVAAGDLRPHGSIASSGTQVGAARWHIDNTGTIGEENTAPPRVDAVINEVLIDPSGLDAGKFQVELHNELGDEALDVTGWKLCLESSVVPGTTRCFTLPQATIAPNGFLLLNLNRVGANTQTRIFTGPFQDLLPARGSLFLLLGAREDDPNNLQDFLRWGSASHGESLATAAGIWSAGQSIDVTLARDGSSIAYSGSGDVPESYRIDITPSLGEQNQEGARNSPFRRGDCNDQGKVDLSDSIFLLTFLFGGGKAPLCQNACDLNDDEVLDISDPVFLLLYLFSGGQIPPAPGPSGPCALDPDPATPDTLSCGSYLSC